jgi:hypothetical protein
LISAASNAHFERLAGAREVQVKDHLIVGDVHEGNGASLKGTHMQTKEHPDAPVTPADRVSNAIVIMRGERVILDRELAAIYGVSTKRLNEQVRRNIERFPRDFMFQLTEDEAKSLRSQFATLDVGRGRYMKYAPYAFTEHGAVQAANVLNSPHAIAMGIYVVRVFVQLRQFACSQEELRRELAELEETVLAMDEKNQRRFRAVYAVLEALTKKSQDSPRRPIGFTADLEPSG